MVRRHFGESLFAAQNLGDTLPETLLDLGSGAGFPGVPIALVHSGMKVTLAESQNKKATFLREVVRTLGLSNVELWGARAESMPSERQFHTVALRAVDHMDAALSAAAPRASHQIVLLATGFPRLPDEFKEQERIGLPESESGFLLRAIRS
jgi:16S rRNA (guanine527-N7)-methyltransferase